MGITINYQNGQLGKVQDTNDKVSALLVASTKTKINSTGLTCFTGNNLNDAVVKLESATDLVNDYGFDTTALNDDAVKYVYQQVVEFFQQAGDGVTLYLMCVGKSDLTDGKINDLVDTAQEGYLVNLLNYDSNISMCAIAIYDQTATTVGNNGFDDDSYAAIAKMTSLINSNFVTADKQQPLFGIVEGRSYQGTEADLTDLTGSDDNRSAVTLIQTASMKAIDSGSASVGLVLGSVAALPVQRRISRVKNGAINTTDDIYMSDGSTLSEDVSSSVTDKHYIITKKYPRKTGYFFASDYTATAGDDDYSRICYRRAIDKVHRIAYRVYVDELDNEILLAEDGSLDTAEAKRFEGLVESKVETLMVDADPAELSGFDAYVDASQDVVSNGMTVIAVKPQPVGYTSNIVINLGFSTTS